MKNPLADFVAYRVHGLARKGSSESAIAQALHIPHPRLKELMDGAVPSKEEAQALAKVLGGSHLDYRPFTLADDTWWSSQPPAVQAEVQRLMRDAVQAPEKLLASESRYGRRTAIVIFTAIAAVVASLGFALYTGTRYKGMNKEARAWAIRNSGSKLLAKTEVEIEECKKNILSVQALDPLVDQTYPEPEDRAKARRILLDLIRFYKATGFQLEETRAQIQARLGNPDKWRYDSVVLDPITGQPVDLERPDGGTINMELLRKMAAVDLRTESFLTLSEEIATGKQNLDAIPPMEKWAEKTKGEAPFALWKKPAGPVR